MDLGGMGNDVSERASKIDWSRLTHEDGVRLGLALGMLRDTRGNHAVRKAISDSIGSTFVVTCLLATLFIVLGLETGLVLALSLLSMLVRVAVVSWQAYRVQKELAIVEGLTCDVIDELADRYPQARP